MLHNCNTMAVERIFTVTVLLLFCVEVCTAANHSKTMYHIPDEQRLYRHLMWGYERSARPVMNSNDTVRVLFKLTLNQITDLDEKSQSLTTNVFIDQIWTDENLAWDPRDYNNIKTMRLPEHNVWLPDTFLFNNADDGSTGFMRGMYVLVDYNGTILWPVPVKLKSTCKVDIKYFPFDDQYCQWRFGSWIYSGDWIDFKLGQVDFSNFIDNSEWELLQIEFQKSYVSQTPFNEDHSDLRFTLHIRRRTLYYIFNVIAPCVMLSVLTLLTFWLPTTSGEKISLGLSVFLAFSMFILLIAEEVPAQSESVPLIGIYLTTVMSMTAVSVIMAVMVINLYNRGSQAVHAPKWMRVFILEGLSRLLCLKHDIEKTTDNIKLDKDEEAKYACVAHPPILSRKSLFKRVPSFTVSPPHSPVLLNNQHPPVHVTQRVAASTVSAKANIRTQNNFTVKVTPKIMPVYDDVIMSDQNAGREVRKMTYSKDGNSNMMSGHIEHLFKKNKNLKNKNNNVTTRCCTGISNAKNMSCLKNSVVSINGVGHTMPSTVIPKIMVTDSENPIDLDHNAMTVPESPVWRRRDSVIKRENEYFRYQKQTPKSKNRSPPKEIHKKSKVTESLLSQNSYDIVPTETHKKSKVTESLLSQNSYDIVPTETHKTNKVTESLLSQNSYDIVPTETHKKSKVTESLLSQNSYDIVPTETHKKSKVTESLLSQNSYDIVPTETHKKSNVTESLLSQNSYDIVPTEIHKTNVVPVHDNKVKTTRIIDSNSIINNAKEENEISNTDEVKSTKVDDMTNNCAHIPQKEAEFQILPAITITPDNDVTTVPDIKITPSTDENASDTNQEDKPAEKKRIPLKVADVLGTEDTPCPKKAALLERRQIVVEWQTIATVVDRLLFWIFLVGTLLAYIVILFVIPYSKPKYNNDDEGANFLYRSRAGEIIFGPNTL